MYMIEISALDNGAHRNQSYNGVLPDGWAVVPSELGELENFPFGEIEVEEWDAYPAVVKWTPLPIPEPEPAPEPEPTADELIDILLGVDE